MSMTWLVLVGLLQGTADAGPVDVNADLPPPSSFDKQQQARGESSPALTDDGPTLIGQAVRTLVSLGVVVGLIYLFGRFGLKRLAKNPRGGSGRVQVLERLALDGKQSLLVVQVEDQQWLIGAHAEAGLRTLATLSPAMKKEVTATTNPPSGFVQVLASAAAPSVPENPDHG